MCILHVSSLTCSFKSFLGQTSLPVYRSHEQGDKARKMRDVYYDHYGFSCTVSEREWTDLDGQFEDAEKFIRKYEDEIKLLYESFEISDVRFDFPYECRLNGRDVCVQGDYLPASFAGLCGKYNIGIALSHYPACEDGD